MVQLSDYCSYLNSVTNKNFAGNKCKMLLHTYASSSKRENHEKVLGELELLQSYELIWISLEETPIF